MRVFFFLQPSGCITLSEKVFTLLSARRLAVGRNDTPVPEPTTWAMMLLGFAGLGLAGYRHANAGGATLARPIG